MSTRDDFTAKIKLQLDELNAQMAQLDAKNKEDKADAREAYEVEMNKLRQQSELARAKYEELQIAGEDSWEKMKAEMEKIRNAFAHSFSYFKSQI